MLGKAVLVGFTLGAVGLGIASYVTADDSNLLFSRGDQTMMGAFAGAVGGALAGLLLWAAVVVAGHAFRLLRRTQARRL